MVHDHLFIHIQINAATAIAVVDIICMYISFNNTL